MLKSGSRWLWMSFFLLAVLCARVRADSNFHVLASFVPAPHGSHPGSALVLGPDGDLYGTTFDGGTYNDGTIFRVTRQGVVTTLLSFRGAKDGFGPGSLILAKDGNFYGTTYGLGPESDEVYPVPPNSLGTIFKWSPGGQVTTLFSFGGNNGAYPVKLIQGLDGNFYGTTGSGGNNYTPPDFDGYGTVFKATPDGSLTTYINSRETPMGKTPGP